MTSLPMDQILCEEAHAIHDIPLKSDDCLYRNLNELGSASLCLSGGGIRSAAFALGLIQALAIHPRSLPTGSARKPVDRAEDSLLAKFHYISTVSGGGYIGSWLSAWRLNEPFHQIWKQLIDRPGGPDREPDQISWLRSFTNYLTPRRGIGSIDTWTALVLWERNLLLNWLVLLPPLCVLVLGVKLLALTSTWVILWCVDAGWYPRWESIDWLVDWPVYTRIFLECSFGIAALFCIGRALAFATANRPSRRSASKKDGPDQLEIIRGYVLWSLLSAFLLTHFLASDLAGNVLLQCADDPRNRTIVVFSFCREHLFAHLTNSPWNIARYPIRTWVASAAVGAVVYSTGYCVCFTTTLHNLRPQSISRSIILRELRDIFMWTISGAAYGAIVGLGFYYYLIIPDQGVANMQVYFLHFVYGVPWILGAQLIADMLFAGLSSYESGSDADREWSGRVASLILVTAVMWLILTFVVSFGILLRRWLEIDSISEIQNWITRIGAVSGIFAAIFGKDANSPASGTPTSGTARRAWPYVKNLLLVASAFVFIIALLIAISYAFDNLLFRGLLLPKSETITETFSWGDKFVPLLIALAIFAAIGAGASLSININRFSLHALYRNRLIHAFLGAASRTRKPDSFTEFDPNDNPKMHQLWSQVGRADWRPFHIINIALNCVRSRRLAWQERKAEPFTVSPLHCGNKDVHYRRSTEYGDKKGISLGTAMAISGAAASPNMGYHSSPGVTFLMTIFNVRLGWWLGNPRRDGSYGHEGPVFAMTPLVQEALGLTTDDRKYVYLSDGGHFENLGLYEMVRRRCRYIIVCDAGYDPSFEFDDLANAVRKIEIDLGVKVRFTSLEKLKPRPKDGSDLGPGHPYCASGEIDYRAADGADKNGIILYIKAGYHGVESAGVRGYASANREFPHESTVDQWFTESQFESYRALGFEITDGILNDLLYAGGWVANPGLENIFETLQFMTSLKLGGFA
jgi:hypothetical protein